jgi:DNA-binding transcriptional regulator YiaG
MQVAHKNGHAEDCRAENLTWKTPLGNTADKLGHGSRGAKLSVAQVREIRELHGLSQRQIARLYGISQVMVHHIKSRRSWRDLESINQTGECVQYS